MACGNPDSTCAYDADMNEIRAWAALAATVDVTVQGASVRPVHFPPFAISGSLNE